MLGWAIFFVLALFLSVFLHPLVTNDMVSDSAYTGFDIIFEDSYLLVIDKPHGLLSQPDQTGDPDVVSLCKHYLSDKTGTRNPYVGSLHRLDRPVGGLMMLAKTRKAARDLSKQMRDRLVQKTYHAIVTGRPPSNGVLTHFLIKNKQTNVVQTASRDQEGGKEATLSFVKIKSVDDLSLLSIHLQTGRTHQIRVQLAAEGYPVWGDYKYGREQPDGRSIALRSVALAFNHPENKKEMQFELEPGIRPPWPKFSS